MISNYLKTDFNSYSRSYFDKKIDYLVLRSIKINVPKS